MVVSKVVPMQEDFRFKLSIKSLGAKEFGSFAVTSDTINKMLKSK